MKEKIFLIFIWAFLVLAWENQNTSFYIKMVTLLKIKTGYICK